MRVDLGPMPYKHAMELVKWCAEHDIDRARAIAFVEDWSNPNAAMINDEEWYLDVPDKYLTYFLIKWSGNGNNKTEN